MANFLNDLRAKRDAGEISTSTGSSVKITGEGHFTAQLVEAKWDKNRNGDAEQGRLAFKVVAVRKETDPSEIGSTFSEYISLKNEDMAMKKYLQISDWMVAAGVKEEKLVDEDDETIAEAMKTLVLAASKYAPKKTIVCDLYRKASDKVDSKGRPYFNNYFDDPSTEEETSDASVSSSVEKEAAAPVAAASPYKAKKANKHAVDEDED